MSSHLEISVWQHTNKGRKARNQDFHGCSIPEDPVLASKGAAIVLADGISSSDVSHVASEIAVTGFLADYFCTPEPWSVRKSAQRVLTAINSTEAANGIPEQGPPAAAGKQPGAFLEAGIRHTVGSRNRLAAEAANRA